MAEGDRYATLEESRGWFPGIPDTALQACIDAGCFRIWADDGMFMVQDLSAALAIIDRAQRGDGDADTGGH